MPVNIIIDSKFDDRGIRKAQADLQQMAGNAAKRVAQVGAAVAAAGAVAAGKLAVDAVNAASDFEESINAVNVAFGDAAQGVLDIGENAARSMGLSREEFNSAAVRFSAFAERVVGEGGNVANFIGDVSTRAADFASVFNIEVSEALQVFQSGLAGEAEPLKRFGINLLQSEVAAFALANGISESASQMTEAEKVQARYGLLMEQTSKTTGDFANTSDGLANSQRILRAELSNLQVEIGSALLPIAKDLVTTFADNLMPRLEDFAEFLRSPEGIESVREFGAQVENVVNFLLDFAGFIADNLGNIIGLGIAIAGVTTAVKLYGVAVQIATIKQAALNATIALNPFGLLAIGIAAVTTALGFGVAALINYNNASDETNQTAEDFRTKIQAQHEELQILNSELESGAISQREYDRRVEFLTGKLEELRIKLARTYEFTEAQTEASYRARDAAIANRFANENLKTALENTGTGYNDLAFAATNAKLGIESVTIAEEAQRLMEEQSKLPDHLHTYKSYEQILAEVAAKTRFQTEEQVAFNEVIRQTAIDLGLVVPGADAASQATSRLTGANGELSESYRMVASEIDRASASQSRFRKQTLKEEIQSGAVRVQTPGGTGFVAAGEDIGDRLTAITRTIEERVGAQAVDRILKDTLGGTEAQIRAELGDTGQNLFTNAAGRTVGLGFQGASTAAEMAARGFTQTEFRQEGIGVGKELMEDVVEQVAKDIQEGRIPGLAKGGIVHKPTLSLIGEAGPEAVIPLSKLNRMQGGNTYVINVNASSRIGGAQAGEEVVNALKTYNTNNGDFNRALTGFGA